MDNLPIPLTDLIGRADALADLARALEVARLVTLTGPGGVGKTRVALAAMRNALPDGVWLVELAPISDPALVPQAIAEPLGIREGKVPSLTDTLLKATLDRAAPRDRRGRRPGWDVGSIRS